MQRYSIPLVPGPVSIPEEVLTAYGQDFGSADLEEEFFDLYRSCEEGLRRLLSTKNSVAILSGEGMLALWGALKSVLRPGDRVLAVATGVFGFGIGAMAQQLGADVEVLDFGYDRIADAQVVKEAAARLRPRLVTAVHCETPSGTLNPLAEIGAISKAVDSLFYVDFVASAGGTPVLVDEWQIDLGLLGSQKVLSLMPDLAMVTISEQAWETIEDVGYSGYDALQPWRRGVANRYLPYTHNWQAMAGLRAGLDLIELEGLEECYRRHAAAAQHCRSRLRAMDVRLWPADEAYSSPTVTAACVPEAWTWPSLDRALRARGMVVGGSYGPLADKVFRIGHMGTQASLELVEQGMQVLSDVLSTRG